MGNSAFIRFVKTGQAIPLEAALSTYEGREQYLKPFTGSATVECLCVDPPVPMTVAHRRVGTETWYLCPASATAKHRHAEWCPLHIHADHQQADVLEAPPAVVVEENQTIVRGASLGTWREATPGGVTKADPHAADEKKTEHPSNLISLMLALWSQSELNVWKPAFLGKRFYGSLRGRLLSGARKVTLEMHHQTGISLADNLHIPPAWSAKDPARKAECARFETMLRGELCNHQILLMAGQLRKLDTQDAHSGCMLYLSHFRYGLWLPPGLWKKLEESTRQWDGGMAVEEGENRFVMAKIRAKSIPASADTMPEIECVGCSVGRFSKEWIPINSRYDQQICDQLVAAGREFEKLLGKEDRKDWISGLCNKLGVTPDFVLIDRKPAVFMEILDRMGSDASYRASTAEKMAIYQRAKRPVWVWDACKSGAIPELP